MTEIDVLRIRETKDGRPTHVEIVTVDTDSLAASIRAEYVEVYHRKVGRGGRPYVIVCDEIGRISERLPTAVAVTAPGPYKAAAFFGDILLGLCARDPAVREAYIAAAEGTGVREAAMSAAQSTSGCRHDDMVHREHRAIRRRRRQHVIGDR